MSSITFGRSEAGFVVRVRQHGTLRESRALVEFLAHIQEPIQVDLDLSAVAYLDSTFLGSLMGLHKRINLAHRGRFRICGPLEAVRRLMGKTRLDTVLTLVEEVPPVAGEERSLPMDAVEAVAMVTFIADAHRRLAELGGPDSEAFARVADQLDEESRRHPRPMGEGA